MTRVRLMLGVVGATLLMAAPAAAQERGQGAKDIPAGYRPPPGMCRIWLDNVPPGQQPAPTDCAAAVRNRPSNGRVIFGDEPKDKSRFGARPDRGRDDVWERARDRKDEKKDDRKANRKDDDRDRGGDKDRPKGGSKKKPDDR